VRFFFALPPNPFPHEVGPGVGAVRTDCIAKSINRLLLFPRLEIHKATIVAESTHCVFGSKRLRIVAACTLVVSQPMPYSASLFEGPSIVRTYTKCDVEVLQRPCEFTLQDKREGGGSTLLCQQGAKENGRDLLKRPDPARVSRRVAGQRCGTI
jgi:hypothetical protein